MNKEAELIRKIQAVANGADRTFESDRSRIFEICSLIAGFKPKFQIIDLDAFGSACICPRVVIECRVGHVSKSQMRVIANDLHASVLRKDNEGTFLLFGNHREDCGCKR